MIAPRDALAFDPAAFGAAVEVPIDAGRVTGQSSRDSPGGAYERAAEVCADEIDRPGISGS